MAKLCSMPARHRSGLALRPSTQRRAKFSAALANNAMDCKRLCAMTGSMTSNSKLPAWPDTMRAVSFPMTWAATIITDSAMTGLTLPGMMEDPGCVSGRRISPRPQRGPDPNHRMSLRSEEHTSELQSQSNLVCRLLLEKKKNSHPIRSYDHKSEPNSHSNNLSRILREKNTKVVCEHLYDSGKRPVSRRPNASTSISFAH